MVKNNAKSKYPQDQLQYRGNNNGTKVWNMDVAWVCRKSVLQHTYIAGTLEKVKQSNIEKLRSSWQVQFNWEQRLVV